MPDALRRAGLARLALVLLLPVLLAACAGRAEWAPDEVVSRALHPNGGDSEITLITVVNNRSGSGDHSALLISGDHRIIYDPAGTFQVPQTPRRNDVLYGISPQAELIYYGYHARDDAYRVIAQTVEVSPAQAAAAMRAAEAESRAGPGMCAIRTGRVLRSVPGFEGLSGSPFPNRLADSFGQMPGVSTREIRQGDLPPAFRTITGVTATPVAGL